MGLAEMTPEKLQEAKKVLALFAFYGISEEDVKAVSEIRKLKDDMASLKAEVATLKQAKEKSERAKLDGTKSIAEIMEEAMKPEQELKV